MRLMKAQNTNLRNIYGKGIRYDIDQQVIIDSVNAVLLSKGLDGERPAAPSNGHMRYNTTSNEFEFYQNGAWRNVKYKEPNSFGIVIQDLGDGDANAIIFGPLDSQDTNPLYKAPIAAQNIIVTVGNVFQIAIVNYDLITNPLIADGDGSEVTDGNLVIGQEYYIADLGTTTDWASVGVSATPANGSLFTASATTSNGGPGDGVARLQGTYLEFGSPPPAATPVRATHNFDK